MGKLNWGWLGAALVTVGVGCGVGGSGSQAGGLASQSTTDQNTVGPSSGGDNDGGVAAPARLTDAQVLTVLQTANQGEIDQANAALTCLSKPKVKDFAQMMI